MENKTIANIQPQINACEKGAIVHCIISIPNKLIGKPGTTGKKDPINPNSTNSAPIMSKINSTIICFRLNKKMYDLSLERFH